MGHDDEPLIGGHGYHSHGHRFEKIKTIALVVLTVLFLTFLALFVWQITIKHPSNNNVGPGPYSWLADDITAKMDTSANPCTDFYQYVCGGYEANTVLPAGVDMLIPVFDVIQETNDELMNWIANGQWPLLGDLMDSCMMPQDALSQDAFATILNLYNQNILPLNSTSDKDILPLLAKLHLQGSMAFFTPLVQNNIFQDYSDNYLNLEMSGLSLSAVYYEYSQYMAALAELISQTLSSILDNKNMDARAKAVVNLEIAILQMYPDLSDATYQDYLANMTFANFIALSGMDYSLYTTALNVPLTQSDIVIITMPTFFQNLTTLLTKTSLQTVTDYLLWHTYLISPVDINPTSQTSFIASKLRRPVTPITANQHSFVNTTFLGKSSAADDSDQQASCVAAANSLLGDYFGLLFNLMIVNQNVIDDIHNITVGIQTAFSNSLPGLTWLDEASRQSALTKLSQIIQIIGHPNKLDRYKNVNLDSTHFMDNVLALNQYTNAYQFSAIGQPFNRSDYEFDATVVNAFYSPFTNTINFPAGILESPMFSTSFPKMLQFARMGYVIGHENTHGFDNTGRLFDGHGVYTDIMDDQSGAQFTNRAQCLVNQYNKFSPFPGVYVDGEQTLGENIADLGGAKNAFRAYKAWVASNGMEFNDHQVISSLTNDQLFFVMLGQTWCTKASQQGIQTQIANDVHSPSKYRVNGPLSNFDEFANAFSCPASSAMVNQPQCVLW